MGWRKYERTCRCFNLTACPSWTNAHDLLSPVVRVIDERSLLLILQGPSQSCREILKAEMAQSETLGEEAAALRKQNACASETERSEPCED